MPVSEGIWKKAAAQAAGAVAAMLASPVRVTTRGVAALLAATTSAVVRRCDTPDVAVEPVQVTVLLVPLHPLAATGVVRLASVKPTAWTVVAGQVMAGS